MSNYQAILNNIQPGDILLSRKAHSPAVLLDQEHAVVNWPFVFFYLGDNKVLASNWYGVAIYPLSFLLSDRFCVGLYRYNPCLTSDQQTQVVDYARKLAGAKKNFFQKLWVQFLNKWWNLTPKDYDFVFKKSYGMNPSELIATAYKKIDIRLKDLPPCMIEPADFDESDLVIRIA